MNTEQLKPYNLRVSNYPSEFFSQKLSNFTDRLLLSSHKEYGKLLKQYAIFANLHPNDALLDFLITGVLFNTYANQDQKHIRIKSQLLNLIYKLRKVNPSVKRISDQIRGKLAYKWLSDTTPAKKEHKVHSFDFLIHFLKGTSEYSEEIIRIRLVKKFLKSLPQKERLYTVFEILELADSFEKSTEKAFDNFTSNVNAFWKTNKKRYIMQENYFFCGKKPVEYHLNMVGAELMNRTLNPTYINTQKQVILVPTCMIRKQDCQKKVVNGELTCNQCSNNCNVNKILQKFSSPNTRIVLIPHSSNFSTYLKPYANQTETGLIGIACVLNLLKGGFEMKRLNIPSQCIFLNYSGCTKHWHTGIATNLNKNTLKKALNQVKEHKTVLQIA